MAAFVLVVAALFLCCPECARHARVEAAKKDGARVEAWLKEHEPTRKWQTPVFVDGAAVARAYPGVRFFFVVGTSVNGTPVGADGELSRQSVCLRVRVAADGTITPLRQPADYNVGLFPVANDADVTLAATAIFTLETLPITFPGTGMEGAGCTPPGVPAVGCAGPGPTVTVSRMPGGWDCAVKGPSAQGNIVFDGKGRVHALAIKARAVATASR